MINTADLLTTHLPQFIEELRLAGYNLGTTQFIQTQQLLLALAKQGALPTQLVHLKNLLGPLLCHSPREQEDFQWRFDSWLKRVEKIEFQRHLSSQPRPFFRIPRVWQWGLMTAILLSFSLFLWMWFNSLTVVAVTGVVLLGAYFLLKHIWQQYLVKFYLPNKFVKVPSNLQLFSIQELSSRIFQPIQLWRVVQQLRQPVSTVSESSDIIATLANSIVDRLSQTVHTTYYWPEYLVLSDPPLVAEDHQAAYFDAVFRILEAEGIGLTRYYFDYNTQCGYSGEQRFTLLELEKRYRCHHLLVFAHGDNLRYWVVGSMENPLFSGWPQRAIFTLEPQMGGELGQAKVPILPANQTGLKYFADSLVTPFGLFEGSLLHPSQLSESNRRDHFPPLLYDSPHRWLEPQAPKTVELKQLLKQIYLYLGKDTYDWFSACAVYPTLHWQLTLYLGDKLIGEPNQDSLIHESLFKLIRLPWFRHGQFPEWLRKHLIKNLLAQPKRYREIHKILEEFMSREIR